MNKIADVDFPVIDLIRNRWSPRSFSDRIISIEDMNSLFEAARWSASANNEQPWEYIYAFRGTEGFNKVHECLLPGNQTWAKNASVLIISVARKLFAKSNKSNLWAFHDVGLANSQMLLQALSMNIYGHPMAGFDKEKIRNQFSIDPDKDVVCVIALGYLGNPQNLEEPFLSREIELRVRNKIEHFIKQV